MLDAPITNASVRQSKATGDEKKKRGTKNVSEVSSGGAGHTN